MSRDFLSQCLTDTKSTDQAALTNQYCLVCRQPECIRSNWGKDRFGTRVLHQVDRLFHSPQADPASSRYSGLVDFQDMLGQAIRLEMSDRRGDWSVPDEPVQTGRPQLLPSAASSLARRPSKFMLDPPAEPEPEPELNALDAEVVQDPPSQPAPPQAPQGQPATVAESAKLGAADVKMGNTPKVSGLMIGGGPVPNPARTPVYDDPWAVPATPKPQVVKPGAKIKMGGGDGSAGG